MAEIEENTKKLLSTMNLTPEEVDENDLVPKKTAPKNEVPKNEIPKNEVPKNEVPKKETPTPNNPTPSTPVNNTPTPNNTPNNNTNKTPTPTDTKNTSEWNKNDFSYGADENGNLKIKTPKKEYTIISRENLKWNELDIDKIEEAYNTVIRHADTPEEKNKYWKEGQERIGFALDLKRIKEIANNPNYVDEYTKNLHDLVRRAKTREDKERIVNGAKENIKRAKELKRYMDTFYPFLKSIKFEFGKTNKKSSKTKTTDKKVEEAPVAANEENKKVANTSNVSVESPVADTVEKKEVIKKEAPTPNTPNNNTPVDNTNETPTITDTKNSSGEETPTKTKTTAKRKATNPEKFTDEDWNEFDINKYIKRKYNKKLADATDEEKQQIIEQEKAEMDDLTAKQNEAKARLSQKVVKKEEVPSDKKEEEAKAEEEETKKEKTIEDINNEFEKAYKNQISKRGRERLTLKKDAQIYDYYATHAENNSEEQTKYRDLARAAWDKYFAKYPHSLYRYRTASSIISFYNKLANNAQDEEEKQEIADEAITMLKSYARRYPGRIDKHEEETLIQMGVINGKAKKENPTTENKPAKEEPAKEEPSKDEAVLKKMGLEEEDTKEEPKKEESVKEEATLKKMDLGEEDKKEENNNLVNTPVKETETTTPKKTKKEDVEVNNTKARVENPRYTSLDDINNDVDKELQKATTIKDKRKVQNLKDALTLEYYRNYAKNDEDYEKYKDATKKAWNNYFNETKLKNVTSIIDFYNNLSKNSKNDNEKEEIENEKNDELTKFAEKNLKKLTSKDKQMLIDMRIIEGPTPKTQNKKENTVSSKDKKPLEKMGLKEEDLDYEDNFDDVWENSFERINRKFGIRYKDAQSPEEKEQIQKEWDEAIVALKRKPLIDTIKKYKNQNMVTEDLGDDWEENVSLQHLKDYIDYRNKTFYDKYPEKQIAYIGDAKPITYNTNTKKGEIINEALNTNPRVIEIHFTNDQMKLLYNLLTTGLKLNNRKFNKLLSYSEKKGYEGETNQIHESSSNGLIELLNLLRFIFGK